MSDQEALLLALDPGEATGFVLVPCVALPAVLAEADFPEPRVMGVLSLWRGVDRLIADYRPCRIVIEQFRLYPNKAAEQSYSTMLAPQVIGAVRCLAEGWGIPVIEQSAATGKSVYLPDAVFAALKSRHIRDAYCHAVKYLKTMR